MHIILVKICLIRVDLHRHVKSIREKPRRKKNLKKKISKKYVLPCIILERQIFGLL